MYHKSTLSAFDKVDSFNSIVVRDFHEQFIRSDKRRTHVDDNSTRHWYDYVVKIVRLTCLRFESIAVSMK